jgi:N-acetylglucosaminyl-diphospho-decaprenol L-rhamnosyltransferase
MAPDVSLIILNWNAASVLGACLDSIASQNYDGRVSILVVDNNSDDDSLALLERYKSIADVLPLSTNLGFAKGNNLGFKEVRSPLVVFMNPDTEFVGTHSLRRLLEPLADLTIGLVGPHVLNADRTTQQSCAHLPSISSLVMFATGIHRILPDSMRRQIVPVSWSHNRSTDTGWLGGSCLAMRSVDFKAIGGFSESTFMYGEDLDLAYRIKSVGLRVRFERSAQMVHYQDVSSSQRWSVIETAEKVAHGELTFLRTRYSPRLANIAQALMYFVYASRACAMHLFHKPQRAQIYDAMASVSRPSWL